MNGAIVLLTTGIVSAYLQKHQVAIADIPNIINTVHGALLGIANPVEAAPEPVELKPAVPVKKSIAPDYLICLEDGKKLKMLKRHLKTSYGLTPNQYRDKWGLPSDYPMVAPNYAASRSALAKDIGLGRRSRLRAAA